MSWQGPHGWSKTSRQAGTCFPTAALLTLCTDALAVSPSSSAAQSGFLSLVFAPSLVGYCFV